MRANNYTLSGFWDRFPVVSRALLATRDGMLWLLPCLVLSSMLVFAASLLDFFNMEAGGLAEKLNDLHRTVSSLYPYLLAASISMMLAIHWRLPRPPVAVLSATYIALIDYVLGANSYSSEILLIFLGITTPLLVVPLLSHLKRMKWARVMEKDLAGVLVKDSLNLIIPAVIVGILVLSIAKSIQLGTARVDTSTILDWVNYQEAPLLTGALYSLLNSMLWFVGVHGYYASLPIVGHLIEAVEVNQALVLAGSDPVNIMNLSFLSSFVFVGGAGATLGLAIALTLCSKDKVARAIGIASIPLAMFNINEILLFGLPIIFNLRLLLPFALAPVVNVFVGLLVIQLGWVSIPVVNIPLNSPIAINGFIATEGDIGAVVLQAFLVMLDVAIYLPFVFLMDKATARQRVYIRSLDTTFSRREEEAYMLAEDPVSKALQKSREVEKIEKSLQKISNREFYLEYQPLVDRNSGQVTACEALIRVRDENGVVQYPGQFLPWFEKANLMSDIDMWVIKRAFEESGKWCLQGLNVSISVNITNDTLTNPGKINDIVTLLSKNPGQIDFEITEESLISHPALVEQAISQLHSIGSSVYIDDFGTGFSSMSYLNQFDIDAIKIDRSFVTALDNVRGQKVFNSLMGFAEQLEFKVVVEGVETTEQFNCISKDSGALVQGWYFSPSLPSEEFVSYCSSVNMLALERQHA